MVFLGVDWGKIISIPFWLDVNPGELSTYFERIFLFVLLVSYGCFFLSKLAQKQLVAKRNFIQAKFWSKFGTFCLTMAVTFTFIFFFRYEAIPVLGGRFWVMIWLISGAIWLGYLIKFYVVHIPSQLADLEKRQTKQKYFVKIKKKR